MFLLYPQVERRASQLTAAMQELTAAEVTGRPADAVHKLSERELRCRVEALALAKMCLHLATPNVRHPSFHWFLGSLECFPREPRPPH